MSVSAPVRLILPQKGVQDRCEPWLSDAVPKPKKQYLVPVPDKETWDHMMQAIKDALETLPQMSQLRKHDRLRLEKHPGCYPESQDWRDDLHAGGLLLLIVEVALSSLSLYGS